MSRAAKLACLALVCTVMVTTVQAVGPQQASGTSRSELLPIDGLHKVTQPDGSTVFLSTNRRFAFVGTMYDLWRGEALALGVAVNQRVDLERNGVSLEKIAMPIGDQLGTTTLFIAPECQDCKELLQAALQTTGGDMNVVLLASSDAGRRANSAVWCATDRAAALRAVYLEDGAPPANAARDCDHFGLMLAHEAAMLFGIGQLPMVLDGNGIGHVGEDAIMAVMRAGETPSRKNGQQQVQR